MTPVLGRVCAAVVTYHPDVALPSRIERVARQVDRVVIVDNTAVDSCSRRLRAVASDLGVHLILNSHNEGIARALNQGARWASEERSDWLLTLDQDSIVAPDIAATLMATYLAHEGPDEVAVVGCNFTNPVSKKAFFGPSGAGGSLGTVVKTVITSGSLVSLQAYWQLGGFRDEFFMDCVDLEYCLRARAAGYCILMTSKPLMEHPVGQLTEHRLLWRKTGTSNHGPLRRYYMMRNTLILAREYTMKEPWWVIAALWSKLKSMLLVVLYESGRLAKLRYSALGFFDGLRGNLNRFC